MKKGNNTLTEYLNFVKKTDRLPKSDLSAVLHGLFGEVGGIMAAAKKQKREPRSFTEFDRVVIEEFRYSVSVMFSFFNILTSCY